MELNQVTLPCVDYDATVVTIYFEVNDVDAKIAELRDKGLQIDANPVGNVICICHAGENQQYPPWRISE